jgi:ParB-like chromosome segregation protein Spo0J
MPPDGGNGDPSGLAIRRVSLDDLHADPGNVNMHDEKNLGTIRGSLKEFGQVEPLVVLKSTGKVIGGNGRLQVMRELGWTEVDIVEMDLTPTQAIALGIALNRTAKTSTFDDTALADTLRALQSEDFDLDAVGYTGDEVDALIERLGSQLIVPEPEPQKEPELKAEHFVEIYCSANDLDEFRSTLDAWGQRAGCTVNIS